MRERTYRYALWEPLCPFGFGLSYTRFVYDDLLVTPVSLLAGESVAVRMGVTNAGAMAGEEVVQLYLSDLETSVEAPIQNLVAFQRVVLSPDERREVMFTVTPEMMMLVDDEGRARLEPGQFRLTVGGCSPGERGSALGAAELLTAVIEVVP